MQTMQMSDARAVSGPHSGAAASQASLHLQLGPEEVLVVEIVKLNTILPFVPINIKHYTQTDKQKPGIELRSTTLRQSGPAVESANEPWDVY